MIWMVISEMLPDAFEHAKPARAALATIIGVALMVFLQEVI
jgi:zinc transporter ZupT